MDRVIDDNRAKRNVVVLVMANAILGAQLPMIFIIGGLALKLAIGVGGKTTDSKGALHAIAAQPFGQGSVRGCPFPTNVLREWSYRTAFAI